MKVSYTRKWDNQGTCYKQTISLRMCEADLAKLNEDIRYLRTKLNYGDTIDGHVINPTYLDTPIKFGDNHLKITQFTILRILLGWKENKRVKDGRNTILKISKLTPIIQTGDKVMFGAYGDFDWAIECTVVDINTVESFLGETTYELEGKSGQRFTAYTDEVSKI